MSQCVNRRQNIKYLEDIGLNIYTKTERKPPQKPPPKVRGKHFSNLEYLVEASLVWLTPDKSKLFPSKTYNEKVDLSYFEQCFITVNKLGEGSFGSVYKVICKEDKKFYAMKVSKEPFRNDWDRTSKVNEVDLHTLVSHHANIATLHNAWEEDRLMYMQLELCKPIIENGEPVSEHKCWDVLIDIVTALDCLHNLGMGHFDVKLENILCGYDGKYKLSDFGLVYHFEKDRNKFPKEGDAKYMAPELLNSTKEFTTKADIFSLGISILELAGNLSLPTNGDVWKALREDTFPLTHSEHMSDDLFYLLTKMMSSKSSLRPSASEILSMPVVKAAIHQRKMFGGVLMLNDAISCSNDILPYVAIWAVFSYLVILTARDLIRNPGVKSDMLMEVDGIFSPGSVSFSAYVASKRQSLEQSPMNTFATSTPFAVPFEPYTKVPRLLNGSYSLSSGKAESYSVSDSNAEASSQANSPCVMNTARNMSDTTSGYSSPCSSLNFGQNTSTFTPSMMSFGMSPIRLSNRLKEVVKANKRKRIMVPRNLSKHFEEFDKGED